MNRRLPIGAIVCCALGACAPSIYPPAPATPVTSPREAAAAPSTINLPISIDVTSLKSILESQVPARQDGEGAWGDAGMSLLGQTVGVKLTWDRDPFGIGLAGNRISASTTVRYHGRAALRIRNGLFGGYSWHEVAQCGWNGDAVPSFQLTLQSELHWQTNWTLTTRTVPAAVVLGAHCRLTAANIDFTDRAQAAITGFLNNASAQVDARLAQLLNVRPLVEPVWSAAQAPLDLGAGSTWLLLRPSSVATADPSGSGATLTEAVGLVASPHIVVGTKPNNPITSLPSLTITTPDSAFHIVLSGAIAFNDASARVSAVLVGKTVEAAGKHVTVTSVRVYGSGDKLVAGIGIKGDARGTLYLLGTPTMDPTGSTVSVPDLDYTIATGNSLIKVADWLKHDSIRNAFRGAMHWNFTTAIAKERSQVTGALNRDLNAHAHLTTTFAGQQPLSAYVLPDSIGGAVTANGTAHLTLH
jgi:hypothetical protein